MKSELISSKKEWNNEVVEQTLEPNMDNPGIQGLSGKEFKSVGVVQQHIREERVEVESTSEKNDLVSVMVGCDVFEQGEGKKDGAMQGLCRLVPFGVCLRMRDLVC